MVAEGEEDLEDSGRDGDGFEGVGVEEAVEELGLGLDDGGECGVCGSGVAVEGMEAGPDEEAEEEEVVGGGRGSRGEDGGDEGGSWVGDGDGESGFEWGRRRVGSEEVPRVGGGDRGEVAGEVREEAIDPQWGGCHLRMLPVQWPPVPWA